MTDPSGRPSPEALLKELGSAPRLLLYLASAPGAGKTRRLLDDALRMQAAGTRVALGWIETKGRPDLDKLASALPRIPARSVAFEGSNFPDFDFAAAIAGGYEHVVLDELAHENLPGGAHDKRWQDALALRAAGISVSGAFNIAHLETVAATAEGLIGFPIREIVPWSFVRAADQVIALDVSAEQLSERAASGAIFDPDDLERARAGVLRPKTLAYLREMMLRAVDELDAPALSPRSASRALAFATGDGDFATFARTTARVAHALDLAVDIAILGERNLDAVGEVTKEIDAHVVPLAAFDPARPRLGGLSASMFAVPNGPFAVRLLSQPIERDTLIVDPASHAEESDRDVSFSRMAQTSADRMRIGYGKLTIYLGAVAGSGKTYAMLDRGHQLLDEGKDVLGALIETHGRAETIAKAEGLPALPRRDVTCDGVSYSELDVDAVLARKPAVALIDELAHSNAPCDAHPKRYDDVLQLLRAGISVMTTLNVQHLEGLGDAVHRMTGQRVRETVPDEILEIADEVILIDTTPEALRERLRAGKIYAPEKIDAALSNFFRTENLGALRELALREMVRARGARKRVPFPVLAVGVKARERDADLIERCARIALRLETDLTVVHVSKTADAAKAQAVVAALEETARRVRARWTVAVGDDPAKALLEAVAKAGASTIAVEGARAKRRWSLGTPFSRRLLEAGAKQLFVLAPPG